MDEEQLRAWAIAHSTGHQFMPQAVAVLKLLERVQSLSNPQATDIDTDLYEEDQQ